MDTLVNELVQFTRDSNVKIRLVAFEQIAGLSSSDDGIEKLKGSPSLIRQLCRNIGDSDPLLSRAVLSTLINLSTDKEMRQKMLANHIVTRVADALLDSTTKLSELYSIILSNMTVDMEGAKSLLQVFGDVSSLPLLTASSTYAKVSAAKNDKYAWVATLLCNISQVKEGRQLLLDENKGVMLSSVLPSMHVNSLVRRRGAVASLKNCLFESEHHEVLLKDYDVLGHILLPLRGPELYDDEIMKRLPILLTSIEEGSNKKEREPEPEIRSMLIDCLKLITSTKYGREKMRCSGVYEIIRDYDKIETDEEIKDAIHGLVSILEGLTEPQHVSVEVDPLSVEKVAPPPQYVESSVTEVEDEEEKEEKKEQEQGVPPKRKYIDEEGDEIEEF